MSIERGMFTEEKKSPLDGRSLREIQSLPEDLQHEFGDEYTRALDNATDDTVRKALNPDVPIVVPPDEWFEIIKNTPLPPREKGNTTLT